MPKIVGKIDSSFKPKDSETTVEGTTFYTTEAIDPKRGVGLSTDRFFLSKNKLSSLDFSPEVGMEVELFYNKYGKVAVLKEVDPLIDL